MGEGECSVAVTFLTHPLFNQIEHILIPNGQGSRDISTSRNSLSMAVKSIIIYILQFLLFYSQTQFKKIYFDPKFVRDIGYLTFAPLLPVAVNILIYMFHNTNSL